MISQIKVPMKVTSYPTVIPLKVVDNNIKIPQNIQEEIHIGSDIDPYEGDYVVTPLVGQDIVLDTKDKTMMDDLTVKAIELQEKTVIPSEDEQIVIADEEYHGLSQVTVEAIPPEYIVPTGTIQITRNGTHDVTEYASADVDVQSYLQNKTAVPSEQVQVIRADGVESVVFIDQDSATAPSRHITSIPVDLSVLTPGETYELSSLTCTAISGARTQYIRFEGQWVAEDNSALPYTTTGIQPSFPVLRSVTVSASGDWSNGQIVFNFVDATLSNKITIVDFRIKTRGYDGLESVTIEAMDQQNKIVTPNRSTQVITADNSATMASIPSNTVSTTFESYEIMPLNTSVLVQGETYHITGTFTETITTSGVPHDYSFTLDTEFTMPGTANEYVTIPFTAQSGGQQTEIKLRKADNELLFYPYGVGSTFSFTVNNPITITSLQYDGLKQVTVEPIPPEYIVPEGTITLTDNGLYEVGEYEYASVEIPGGMAVTVITEDDPEGGGVYKHIIAVDISEDTVTAESLQLGATAHTAEGEAITGTLIPHSDPVLQDKSVEPIEEVQLVEADVGYDGLSSVEVGAIDTDYVGSGVARLDGATITPQAYNSQTAVSAGTYVTNDVVLLEIPYSQTSNPSGGYTVNIGG